MKIGGKKQLNLSFFITRVRPNQEKNIWYLPSPSKRVAPLAKEEIKQKARSKRWDVKGKDIFMMMMMMMMVGKRSFRFERNLVDENESVFECEKGD